MYTTTSWYLATEGTPKSGPNGASFPPCGVESNSGGIVEMAGWYGGRGMKLIEKLSMSECVFSRYRKEGRALQQSEKVGQTSTSVNHSRKEKRGREKR